MDIEIHAASNVVVAILIVVAVLILAFMVYKQDN